MDLPTSVPTIRPHGDVGGSAPGRRAARRIIHHSSQNKTTNSNEGHPVEITADGSLALAANKTVMETERAAALRAQEDAFCAHLAQLKEMLAAADRHERQHYRDRRRGSHKLRDRQSRSPSTVWIPDLPPTATTMAPPVQRRSKRTAAAKKAAEAAAAAKVANKAAAEAAKVAAAAAAEAKDKAAAAEAVIAMEDEVELAKLVVEDEPGLTINESTPVDDAATEDSKTLDAKAESKPAAIIDDGHNDDASKSPESQSDQPTNTPVTKPSSNGVTAVSATAHKTTVAATPKSSGNNNNKNNDELSDLEPTQLVDVLPGALKNETKDDNVSLDDDTSLDRSVKEVYNDNVITQPYLDGEVVASKMNPRAKQGDPKSPMLTYM